MTIRQAAAVFAVSGLFACSGATTSDGGTGGGSSGGSAAGGSAGGGSAGGGSAGGGSAGGGSAGGGSAGGGSAGGGSAGGGSAGGGSAGGGSSGGGSAGGGDAGMVDPCSIAIYDPMLGTLAAQNGAHAVASQTLPFGLTEVADLNGTLYGLYFDGSLLQLDAGNFVNIIPAEDRDGGAFPSFFLATSGTHLMLAGYTQVGAGFPGQVAVVDVNDSGIRYINAPGNYSAAGFSNGFAINGQGIASSPYDAGIYFVDTDDGGTSTLAAFDSPGAASGFNAVTSDQVLLLGYYDDAAFTNHVLAAPPLLYSPAVQTGMPFALSTAVEITSAEDISDLHALGTSAIVVHGGYQTSSPYLAFTTSVERIPLTLSGSTVTKGTSVTVLSSTDMCTAVIFTATSGTDLLLGIADNNGSRLVRVTP